MKSALRDRGYVLWRSALGDESLELLRHSVFRSGEAGRRCLLDVAQVRSAAQIVGCELVHAGFLEATAVAVQAVAFDKTAETNWKVAWHQDLLFPFARPVRAAGFDLATVKDGIDFARPPRAVLEDLLAVRVHLDDCDEQNGPLRVSPGTHRVGIIPSGQIPDHVSRSGEAICAVRAGEALLMRPLLLHASSKAALPRHRRVLHLVFAPGAPAPEVWHRAVRPDPIGLTTKPSAEATGLNNP